MEAVGIDPRYGERKPHQFSGGQCQRICIARALVLDPKVIICDEPVSALDVSVQAQILNLLEDMKARYGVTLMFISHDLSVVKNISDRVMVMYMGKTCEVAGSDDLFARPTHHYTRALMAAIPGSPRGRRRARARRRTAVGHRLPVRLPLQLALSGSHRSVPDRRAAVAIGRDGHFVACHHPHLAAARRLLDDRHRPAD